MDIIGGLIGLVLGLPIFVLSIVIVRVFDKVPPIFVQDRMGLGNKSFHFYKLRTLQVKETEGTVSIDVIKERQPYKYTKTGQFWRSTSIDEIAQFWHVLVGEMSLIGYRPIPMLHVPYLHKLEGLNQALINEYMEAVKDIKPGISGLSVIHGRVNNSMKQKIDYDFEYLKRASLQLDFYLVFRTIEVILTKKGSE